MGSLTKVVTGTLLMQMVRAELVGIDDQVARWLPMVPGETKTTLRQLAEHTSGLSRLPKLPAHTDPRDPYAAFGAEEFIQVLHRLDELTERPPGAATVYSNLGYAVLGAALEAAGKAQYEDLVHRYVLAPLVIDEITAHPAEDRVLTGRDWRGRPRAPWTMDGPILPAGGLWATPRAAAALVTALLVDRALGEPAPSWQIAGELRWHNGATRDASVFAAAFPGTTDWVLVHRLGGRPVRTDSEGLDLLAAARKAPEREDAKDKDRAS
ncbi:beta-lactamase family protein [Streptomyces sporangiiformans]|uniref:Beta-lactamase family protein n=2 Tax=Streptomyces sporangiiformans TaxID=2315329 RepID=A0A505DDL5_9ACTN|nr:beta-lactamase family protein [Streptomyces sporangiiformans]